MKPIYEKIEPNSGSSFYMHVNSPGCTEPFWHIHPEFELVYIESGSAERNIGSNVSRYFDGDLMLIGSNIPHSNLGNEDHSDNFEIVVQMGVDFVEKQISSFPEFNEINRLFQLSSHGISFGEKVKKEVGPILKEIDKEAPFNKLLRLISVLHKMATCKNYKLLNAKSANIEIYSNDYARIKKINRFVSENFNKTVQLKEIADLLGLTETSFSRFFKKVTGKTFISFLNEYRIQKACSFLADKNTSIAEIMNNSGFLEPAYFTRTFKKYTSYTPREYRKKLKRW